MQAEAVLSSASSASTEASDEALQIPKDEYPLSGFDNDIEEWNRNNNVKKSMLMKAHLLVKAGDVLLVARETVQGLGHHNIEGALHRGLSQPLKSGTQV